MAKNKLINKMTPQNLKVIKDWWIQLYSFFNWNGKKKKKAKAKLEEKTMNWERSLSTLKQQQNLGKGYEST